MCHGGDISILVIFDMLECYILYMCLLLFVYCILYTCFGGSSAEEADKIGKILMFVGSPTNIRATWGKTWLVGSATWQLCSSGNQRAKGQCGTRVGAGLRDVRLSARWNRRM
jgi:hypothetical protein